MTPTVEVPNPIGVHALVWVGDTSPASVESAVSQTVAAGYDILEFSLHDAVSIDRDKTRELLIANGIAAACSRGLARDADISSDDRTVVARGAALLAESLAVTHDIGATILTGALYSAFGKAPHALTPAGRANVVAVLRDLAAEAAPMGVTLGLEICNRYETNVVNTARDCLRLADDIGADNVVIHLDTYHMNIEEDDLVTPVRDCGERLGYVHIGENHRGYLGSGHIDFAAFFGALSEIDYRGPLTFESFSSAVVAPGLSNDLAIWRNLWDDGFDLATHARRFIHDGLRDAPAARRDAAMIGVAAESDTLARLAEDAIALADSRPRAVLGIAGSPGAGKSTLVEQLLARVSERKGAGWVAHVPMDGFHLADDQLRRLGALDRKGAPDTFDPSGYAQLLERVSLETDAPVYAPGFDRTLEQPLAAALVVLPSARLVVTEGNYLLLDHPAWLRARRAMDRVWFVTGEEDARIDRLVARHVEFGKSPDAAEAWVTGTDQRNAELVSPTAAAADVVIVNSADGWLIAP